MNILLISSIYPLPDNDNHGTAVCHFFAKEWIKMGYNVQSIHIQAVYPTPFYWVAKLNRNLIAAKTGAVVYTERDKGATFVMDGVPVTRIPVYKPIPHGRFVKKSIKKAVEKIVSQNSEREFYPDIILAHFPNPQLEILNMLRDIYPKTNNALIMHGAIGLTKKIYGDGLPELMRSVDCWGFRNEHDRDEFQRRIAPVKKTFLCRSGIPDDYITNFNTHDFAEHLSKFVFVGEMIERKYPVLIIEALRMAYPDGDWLINYIGDGQQLSEIKNVASANHLEKNVSVLGKIPREEIKAMYDAADCLVMISRGEAYGLVYLEAMARGCIVIASRNEGFDGIIKDGVNGFLCEAGNAEELASIIRRISCLSQAEKRGVSENAIATAKGLTDHLAAKSYIDDVMSILN